MAYVFCQIIRRPSPEGILTRHPADQFTQPSRTRAILPATSTATRAGNPPSVNQRFKTTSAERQSNQRDGMSASLGLLHRPASASRRAPDIEPAAGEENRISASDDLRGRRNNLHHRIRSHAKSAVAYITGRKFLGYTFWFAPGGVVKRSVARQSWCFSSSDSATTERAPPGSSSLATVAMRWMARMAKSRIHSW